VRLYHRQVEGKLASPACEGASVVSRTCSSSIGGPPASGHGLGLRCFAAARPPPASSTDSELNIGLEFLLRSAIQQGKGDYHEPPFGLIEMLSACRN
jgi:hypothetical protein